MKQDIVDIRNKILAGVFSDESAVSQGIVLRILECLGWPKYDTSIVFPQYPLEGGRVDFALCDPPGKPVAYVEVKRIGLIGQNGVADLQLFRYAFHRGVPMAILTDGQEWHFFLPAEEGAYDERRVYKLDLLEREPDESVFRLTRYLDYQAVRSRAAIDAARLDYRDIAKGREIQRTLPEAWRRLVEDGDELLLELIADKVESLCGFKPDPDTAARFLAGMLQPSSVASLRRVISTGPVAPRKEVSVPESSGQGREVSLPETSGQGGPGAIGFSMDGQYREVKYQRDVLVGLLQILYERDPTFMDRLAARAKPGKRPYVARSKVALFPKSPLLSENPTHSRELAPGSGWWVDVNVASSTLLKVIMTACEVSGLTYGVDVKVNLG